MTAYSKFSRSSLVAKSSLSQPLSQLVPQKPRCISSTGQARPSQPSQPTHLTTCPRGIYILRCSLIHATKPTPTISSRARLSQLRPFHHSSPLAAIRSSKPLAPKSKDEHPLYFHYLPTRNQSFSYANSFNASSHKGFRNAPLDALGGLLVRVLCVLAAIGVILELVVHGSPAVRRRKNRREGGGGKEQKEEGGGA